MSKDSKSSYYDVGGIEVLEVIKAKLTLEQWHGFLLGNAIKYQLRMMHKTPDSPARDAEKAANYARWLADSMADIETCALCHGAGRYLVDDGLNAPARTVECAVCDGEGVE